MNSILTSIKKLLGIDESYEHFDQDIIMHINSIFFTLKQLGIGPEVGFAISDKSALWKDFIEENKMESVRTYMFLKVRLLFDPPMSSAVMECINQNAKEIEWRLYAEAENEKTVNS